MLGRGAVLLLTASMLLSGCISGEEPVEPTATDEEPRVLIDPDRPTESLGEVLTGPSVGPDLNATTAEAPRLVAGEWWRVRFDNNLDEDIDVIRVVADVHEEGYVMGMPHAGWLKEAIAYHSPAFGDVGLDLSYDTHNVRFEPVRFPLVAGESWQTHFAAIPYTATVEEADTYTAVISFTPEAAEPQPTDPLFTLLAGPFGDGTMRLTYDARMHEIVRMESALGVWEVVEHGYDFEGWVTVPRGEHTAIDYGTFGPVSEQHDALPRTIDVNGGFNRMTLMHVVVPLTPGAYKVISTGPDERTYETNATTDVVIRFYESSSPDGTWTVQDVVGGAGVTYSMGIAYHQYDIRLPDGLRRADHAHPVIR